MAYDIFISYRRKGGYETAKHLYDLLTRDGYSVSFDIDTLRNGDFDVALLQRIEECTDFILILNKGAFDRTLDPAFNPENDWMRNELAHALKLGKNIIPVMLEGFDSFPDNLPADIAKVVRKNGPKYDSYYFDDFYRRMKQQFFETPEPEAVLQPSARRSSCIKVKSNMLFDLYIDNEYKDRIEEDTLCQLSLEDGEYFLEFRSPEDGNIDKVCKTVKIDGNDLAFEIDLRSVADARHKAEADAIGRLKKIYDPGRCYEFFCGLCAVEHNGLYGFVNSKLEEVIPFVYEDYEPFQALSLKAAVKRYGKWGMIDQKGKISVPIEYDELEGSGLTDFPGSDDYVRALKDNRCGIIDPSGNVVVPFEYDAVSCLTDGYVILVKDELCGLYDLKNGELRLSIDFDKIRACGDYAVFYKNYLCGIKILDGSLCTDVLYEEVKSFSEGLCAVRKDGLWGYIDKSGSMYIAPKYQDCRSFSSGLAAVSIDGKWGFIDHTGKLSVPLKYDDVSPMLGGLAVVSSGKESGLVNRIGKLIFPMTPGAIILHDSLAYTYPELSFPKCVVLPDGRHLIVDRYGKVHDAELEGEDDGSYFLVWFDNKEILYTYDTEMDVESDRFISYDHSDVLSVVNALSAETDAVQGSDEEPGDEEAGSDFEEFALLCEVIASRKDADPAVIRPSSDLRKDLGFDDDDYMDLMMALEEEFAVFMEESYFNSLSTVSEIADYIMKLQDDVSEIFSDDSSPEPRLKRGDLYEIDGVEGIVLEFNDETGEGKLVSKRRIVNTWEDPSFKGFFKKIQANAKPTPPDDAHRDGRYCCLKIRKTKDWADKYPCVWWCSNLDGGSGMWYLPSHFEFGPDFSSPEVQKHYQPIPGYENLNEYPAYWTSNSHPSNMDKAYVALPSGSAYAADRHKYYFLVAMRYFKI